MPNLIDTYDVKTMMEALDTTPRPKTFLRDLLAGGRAETFATETVMVDWFKGKRRMAPYVSPIIGGKVMEREGHETKEYTPPLITPRDVITPVRLKNRQAGESVISSKTPAQRGADEQAKVLNLFDDYITRREEWQWAQLIFSGSIRMVGEGVNELYSVGFTQTAAVDTAWDQAASDPLADMGTAVEAVLQNSGITPAAAVMGNDVWNVLKRNAKFLAQMDNLRVQLGQFNPRDLPNGAKYLGYSNDLNLDLYAYMEWYIDDTTGTEMPMVPAGKLAIVPDAQRNAGARTVYGAWTEMAEMQTYEGTRIPRVWAEKGPNALFLEVVSRPLPVMVEVDAWYVLSGLTTPAEG